MILFFGPPGSGKSVQGELLVKRNGWNWVSTGELFRATKNEEVLARLATGELIDDELTNKVLVEGLEKLVEETHVVLDGYPRNPRQAKWLMEFLEQKGYEINVVVVFEVPEEELIRRLAGRGRDEDKLEVIKRRLDIYRRETAPVLQFYESENVPIALIDGTGEVEAVHERIQTAMEQAGLTAK